MRWMGWILDLRRRILGTDDLVILPEGSYTTGAWDRKGRMYGKGDAVPHLPNGHSTYSVKTREGAWINVGKGKIASASKKPIHGERVNVDGYRWVDK